MVDPNYVGIINGDSVTTPDVFGVDVCDEDVS